MSDQSEFEKCIDEHIARQSSYKLNLSRKAGIREGAILARNWILNKAKELDKQYIDDNDFPLIFLDDLEEACK